MLNDVTNRSPSPKTTPNKPAETASTRIDADSTVQEQQLRMAAEVGKMLLDQNTQLKAEAEINARKLTEVTTQADRAAKQLTRSNEAKQHLENTIRELEEALGDGKEEFAAKHVRMKQLKVETTEATAMTKRMCEDNDSLRAQLTKAAEREKALELKVIEANADTTEAALHAKAANHERTAVERRCSAAERRSDNLKLQLAECKIQLREAIADQVASLPLPLHQVASLPLSLPSIR